MYKGTKYNKLVEELVDWGILERNSVNEILPTADFLIWLYNQKSFDADKYPDEALRENVMGAIESWTIQTIDGVSYAKLNPKEHTKIVCTIIQDISDRRMEIYRKESGQR
jgi:hypothetical protein